MFHVFYVCSGVESFPRNDYKAIEETNEWIRLVIVGIKAR